jgi:hypothetical protein
LNTAVAPPLFGSALELAVVTPLNAPCEASKPHALTGGLVVCANELG